MTICIAENKFRQNRAAVDKSQIAPSVTAGKLGVILDKHLFFLPHPSYQTWASRFLGCIWKIWPFIFTTALVLSLDHCNSPWQILLQHTSNLSANDSDKICKTGFQTFLRSSTSSHCCVPSTVFLQLLALDFKPRCRTTKPKWSPTYLKALITSCCARHFL